MQTRITAQQAIAQQIPLFLQLRRRRWTGLQAFIDESHLTRPAFLLLRSLEEAAMQGHTLTSQQMKASLFNPYTTRFMFLDDLPLLIEQDYLQQQNDGYLVTDTGRTLVHQVEIAARTYIASLQVPPSVPLAALAAVLIDLVHRSWQSPEPMIKAHQARTQQRLSVKGAAPLVQVEWAILGLWEVRDDAHIAAWQVHGFSGPVLDILSRTWSKEVHTLSSLISTLEASQHITDIQQGVQELIGRGYIISTNDRLELTLQGQKIRDDIELETDRIFFTPWSQTTSAQVIWLREQIDNVCSYFKTLA